VCRYGTLIAWAEELGHDEIRALPDDQPERGEGGKHQAEHGGDPQRSQREGFDRRLMPSRLRLNGSAKPWSRLFCPGSASSRPTQLAANAPRRHRHDQPGERRADEGGGDAVLYSQRKHDRKDQHTQRAQRRAGGVERGSFLSASPAVEARLSLASDLVLLDQGSAGAEDGRKGQEDTSDGCSIAPAYRAAGGWRRAAGWRGSDSDGT
jgi:hypothetical protein